jgi:ABC-2 type transport system ATP-binding protein/lipopolysaccharide transport system ATP-binding protein
MTEDVTIEMHDVVLDFPVTRSGYLFFKELLTRRSKDGLQSKYYRALNGINLSIKRGEVVGIVGPNGAGKSTLLRVIAGIYAPDQGNMKSKGRMALLAGLGAGFQRNLTGRENIFLSGSIYGMSRQELYDLIPSIVVYSGIGSFIDQPLRTYSSGMKARLAFSIASHLTPDILLIDEVLAVGDSAFREKSKARILDMVKSDATVIIVSHNEATLKEICDRFICLNDGEIDIVSEDFDSVMDRYHELSKISKK